MTARGQSYRIAAVISGQDLFLVAPLPDSEREEAKGWFALIELIAVPEDYLAPPGPNLLAELKVRIPSGPGHDGQWATIEDVRAFKDNILSAYETVYVRDGPWPEWSARPRSDSKPSKRFDR